MSNHSFLYSLIPPTDDLQIKVIQSSILEDVSFYEGIFIHRDSYKPSEILPNCKSVIQLALPVDMTKEFYQPASIKESYRGYGDIFEITKGLVASLKKQGIRSKRATFINQKYCAIQSGQGVLGKQGLILSPKYGTRLRFDAIVTDYVPQYYDKPLNEDLCGNCTKCIDACKYNCISYPLLSLTTSSTEISVTKIT